jgi:hypothetical protein
MLSTPSTAFTKLSKGGPRRTFRLLSPSLVKTIGGGGDGSRITKSYKYVEFCFTCRAPKL